MEQQMESSKVSAIENWQLENKFPQQQPESTKTESGDEIQLATGSDIIDLEPCEKSVNCVKKRYTQKTSAWSLRQYRNEACYSSCELTPPSLANLATGFAKHPNVLRYTPRPPPPLFLATPVGYYGETCNITTTNSGTDTDDAKNGIQELCRGFGRIMLDEPAGAPELSKIDLTKTGKTNLCE